MLNCYNCKRKKIEILLVIMFRNSEINSLKAAKLIQTPLIPSAICLYAVSFPNPGFLWPFTRFDISNCVDPVRSPVRLCASHKKSAGDSARSCQ